jgi:hypothetical protein
MAKGVLPFFAGDRVEKGDVDVFKLREFCVHGDPDIDVLKGDR